MFFLGPALILTLFQPVPDGMRQVGPAEIKLAYPTEEGVDSAQVSTFFLDEKPITNAEMLAFIQAHPEWARGEISETFADPGYLSHWAGPTDLGEPDKDNLPNQPVTRVSWFAARAYCLSEGKRLPTENEWELAAQADEHQLNASEDPEFQKRILDWYASSRQGTLHQSGSRPANAWGIRDLHGGVWEWIHDFDATLITGDARDRDSDDKDVFCGSGSVSAADVANYATFMRYAFRSSLKGNYATSGLGFRCASAAFPTFEPNTPGNTGMGLALTLEDQDGRPVNPLTLTQEGPVVASMFYANCGYACPTLIRDLARAQQELSDEARAKTRFLLVTLDPDADTPRRMKAIAKAHGTTGPEWIFARAKDDDETRQIATSLGITYRRLEGGHYNHSSRMLLLDAQGKIKQTIRGLNQDPKPLIKGIEDLLSGS